MSISERERAQHSTRGGMLFAVARERVSCAHRVSAFFFFLVFALRQRFFTILLMSFGPAHTSPPLRTDSFACSN